MNQPTPRIVVVGTSGSGKSTLAKRIADALSIPRVELDELHWGPNWTEADPQVFRERVEAALDGASWVVDGNYGKIRDVIWSKANTVVWLDYPFHVVFGRALYRTVKRVAFRETLWAGNRETFRHSFLSKDSILVWVLTTYKRRKSEYPVLMARPEYAHLKVVHCKAPRDAEAYLRELGGPSLRSG